MKQADLLSRYAADLVEKIQRGSGSEQPLKGMKIVVDAGNGAGGYFADKVLAVLGADINGSQFLEPDGNFPNHIPNLIIKKRWQVSSRLCWITKPILA